MDGELTWNETGKSRAVENAHPAALSGRKSLCESLIQEIKTTAKDMDLPLSLMELDLGTDQ